MAASEKEGKKKHIDEDVIVLVVKCLVDHVAKDQKELSFKVR